MAGWTGYSLILYRGADAADGGFLNRKALVDWLAMASLALVVGAGYRYSQSVRTADEVRLPPVTGCDLQQSSCRASLPDGDTVTLALAPQPVPLLKPFTVEVGLAGAAGPVEVDFSGVEMDMGYNRVTLQPAGDGHYSGQATLPVCVTGRMTWRVTVAFDRQGRRLAVPFTLATGR